MNLDVKTLFMMVTQGYLSGALVLAALAISVRSIPKPIRCGWGLWAFCLFTSGLGTFLIGQRGVLPDYMSIVIANTFLTISFGMTPNATALLNNKRMPYLYLPAAGTLGWLGLYCLEFFREDIFLRVIYVNLFCLVCILLCLRESWQLNRRQISSWFLTAAFTLDATVRTILISPHVLQGYPSLLQSYETLPLQVCMLVLIVTIVIKVVGISVSIFEMQRKQFQEEAERDALTGLYNQRGFHRKADMKLAASKQSLDTFALVLLEIDNLKSIEKRYGYAMVDAFLKLFSKVSQLNAPAETLSGIDRNGQIAVLLPTSSQAAASSYARRTLQEFIAQSGSASDISATSSAGVYFGSADTPVQRALEIAGHCLRQARKNGGNKVMVQDAEDQGNLGVTDVEIPFARRQKDSPLTPAH